MADTVAIDPAADVAPPVDPAVPIVVIDRRCGEHPAAFLPQLGQRKLSRRLHELLLDVGNLGGHIGDLPGLGLR